MHQSVRKRVNALHLFSTHVRTAQIAYERLSSEDYVCELILLHYLVLVLCIGMVNNNVFVKICLVDDLFVTACCFFLEKTG